VHSTNLYRKSYVYTFTLHGVEHNFDPIQKPCMNIHSTYCKYDFRPIKKIIYEYSFYMVPTQSQTHYTL